MEPTDSVRLATLEQIAKNSLQNQERLEERIDRLDEFYQSVVERLDEHLERDNRSQLEMTATLSKLSVSFDNLSNTLKEISESAKLAVKHEVQLKSFLKFSSWAAALVGAAWAVFTFFSQHPL